MQIKSKDKFYIFIFLYHFAFAFVINYYTKVYIGTTDAQIIYETAQNSSSWYNTFGLGKNFIAFLIFPLVKLGFSYFAVTLIFTTLSLKGFLIFADMFFKIQGNNKINIYFLFLLAPSLHFWSSFIGKDAVCFLAMVLILKYVVNKKFFKAQVIAALLILLIVRPYIFFIVFPIYTISILYNVTTDRTQKIKTIIISILTITILSPLLFYFLKLDSISIQKINENYTRFIIYSSNNGDSSIDLQSSNYLQRLFLVIVKPFFYDAKTIFQYVVSFENLILWGLILNIFIKIRHNFKTFLKSTFFPVTVAMSLILFYSIYMYNLGLASRMRVMFMPYLMFSLYWALILVKKTIVNK